MMKLAKIVKISLKVSKYFAFFALILVINVVLIGSLYLNKNKDKPAEYGVSFSTKYSDELGIDWEESLETILSDLKPDYIRLMSYWDEYEKEYDDYQFDNLDRQMELAEEYGAKVTLAIGARQPRWPECHLPNWAKDLYQGDMESQEFRKQLIDYVEMVVDRYKAHPALESWQLENEAANRVFAKCKPGFDNERLQQEFDAVKALDTEHPLIINASNTSGIPISQPIGDKVGFSVYKRGYAEVAGKNVYWTYYHVPSLWNAFRGGLVDLLHGKESFVHELQAEPWGQGATVDLTQAEMERTMDPEKLEDIVGFARQSGMYRIYLWGAEWWLWQKEVNERPEMWDKANQIFSENLIP